MDKFIFPLILAFIILALCALTCFLSQPIVYRQDWIALK